MTRVYFARASPGMIAARIFLERSLVDLRQFAVNTPDGRRLDATEAGDLGGRPVVVHHGTPGSSLLAPSWVADAKRRGIRLITFARAGYSTSTRLPARSVGQVVEDLDVVLDFLGIDRFSSWGVSAGGPHVLAAACISGVAPYSADGLDQGNG